MVAADQGTVDEGGLGPFEDGVAGFDEKDVVKLGIELRGAPAFAEVLLGEDFREFAELRARDVIQLLDQVLGFSWI